MDQEPVFKEFILNYLDERYSSEFEIIEFKRNTNVTNLASRNTIIAIVFSVDLQKEFHVFFNEKPELIVVDDLYPQLLIETRVQEEVNKLNDYPGKTFVFLENIDKEIRDNYDAQGEIENQISKANISTWKVFILLKTDNSDPEQFKDDINSILNKIFDLQAKDINVECMFYGPKSSVDPSNYSVDRSKNFDARFPDEQNIIGSWLGGFNKKMDDFTSNMRKIKY